MSQKAKRVKRKLTREILVALGIPMVFVPGLILAAILGWNWQKSLGELRDFGGFRGSKIIFPEQATVGEVLDGDTLVLARGQTVRLIGIDAPNRGEKGWEEAREVLADLIEGEKVRLEYDAYQDDKFGRILAYVWEKCRSQMGCRNEERMVNWVMVKKGLARVVIYEDRRKLKYEDFLFEAEGRER